MNPLRPQSVRVLRFAPLLFRAPLRCQVSRRLMPAFLWRSRLDMHPVAVRPFFWGPLLHHQSENTKDTPPEPQHSAQTNTTVHEDIYTLPNILTFSRLAAAPVIGYFVLHDQHFWAAGLFAYAGLTDLLDGFIARRWNRRTVVGSVIDPMADKALMTILTVCLAAKEALPVWLAAIILLRDLGLAISAIYYRWISLPPPKTLARYWDFSLPSAEVRPTTISKINTALQLVLVGLTTVAPLVPYDAGAFLTGLQYVVAVTTVWSGVSYVGSKDAVKILTRLDKRG